MYKGKSVNYLCLIFIIAVLGFMHIDNGHHKIPDAPLKYKLGSTDGYIYVNSKDYMNKPIVIYECLKDIPNVGLLLPLDKEKVIGDDNKNKFFYIEAKETMDPTTGKLIISSVLLGGGGEESVFDYLKKLYGEPSHTYEINKDVSCAGYIPYRVRVWLGHDKVMLFYDQYAHGARSKVKIMERKYYESLNKEDFYFKI